MKAPAAHAIFNRSKALRYWKALRARWVEAGAEIERAVLGIKDERLRYVVAHIIDACASGRGAYVMVPSSEGFHLTELELADSVIDDLLVHVEGDTSITDAAYDWILNVLRGMPATFVAWAFGELLLSEPASSGEGDPLRYLAVDRVVYCLESRRILGVQTHPDFSHPTCRIVQVIL